MAARNLLNTNDMMRKRGCKSRSTIWSDERDGVIPRAVVINGRKFWYEDEVEEWQRSLPRGQGRQFITGNKDKATQGESPGDPPT